MLKQQILSLIRAGRAHEARNLCQDLCAQGSADAEIWVLMGSAQLQLGDAASAEQAGHAAVALNRDEVEAWNLLTHAYFRQGKSADAIAGIRELIRLRPQSAQLHCQLAALLRQQQDMQGAREHYQKAIACDERNIEARIALAELLQEQRFFQEALEQYRSVLGVAPDSRNALSGAGDACMALEKYAEAIEAYQHLLEADPSNGVVHHNLAQAYQNQGRLKEAEASYREAIRILPDRSEPYVNLGRALQKQGRLPEAVGCHEMALNLDPRCAFAHHNLALCAYDDRNLNPAIASFQAAIDLDPANMLARCYLAIMQLQQGDPEGAVASTELAKQAPLTASIIDSYQYAEAAGPRARYFGTTSQILEYAVDNANVDGLFLEFGVCHGTSITMIANQVATMVHGFDSFQGLPESWDTGLGVGAAAESAGAYTTNGVLPPTPDNVMLHVGVFGDTLPGFIEQYPGPVSFINMDCDLYSSTKTVFQCLADRIVPGSVIVFDEYFCYPEWRQHEFKAFQEFVEQHGITYEYLAFSFFTRQAVVRIVEMAGKSD